MLSAKISLRRSFPDILLSHRSNQSVRALTAAVIGSLEIAGAPQLFLECLNCVLLWTNISHRPLYRCLPEYLLTADFLDMISRDQVLSLSIDRNSLWLLWNWSWQVLVNSSYINSVVWSVSHRQDLTSLSTSPVPRTGSLKETPTFVGQLGLTLKPAHSTCYQRRRIDAVSFRWVVKFCGGDSSH